MMAQRMREMHRLLNPSGSLYLHCDPTAGHYLKLLMDVVFGKGNFRNEIVWCYAGVPDDMGSITGDGPDYFLPGANYEATVKALHDAGFKIGDSIKDVLEDDGQ